MSKKSLTLLDLTPLPLLVHNSVLLKQIQDSALEKILELYTQTPKQVFIALDTKGSYTPKTQEILKHTQIIRLYPHSGELFGRAWNDKKNYILSKRKTSEVYKLQRFHLFSEFTFTCPL